MAYGLHETSALEVYAERALAVEAALAARPELKDLAPEWLQLSDDIQIACGVRNQARHRVVRASAVMAVIDVAWDETIDGLYQQSRYIEAPLVHEELFRGVTASEARDLGADRALELGAQLTFRLEKLDAPRLKPFLAPLKAANEALSQAQAERTAAETAMWEQNLIRLQWMTRLQQALAKVEAQILGISPGNRALVRAVLGVPERPRHAPAPAPAA